MVQPGTIKDDVQRWLEAMGVESLCQWDVIVFLNRHQTILMSPEQLARRMGYQTAIILGTLDSLAAHGFVRLSSGSSSARLYQSTTPTDPPQQEALRQLLALGNDRPGCLLLREYLRRRDRRAGAAPVHDGQT